MSTYAAPSNNKKGSYDNQSEGNNSTEFDNIIIINNNSNSYSYNPLPVTSLPLPQSKTDPAPSTPQAYPTFELQSHRSSPSLQDEGHKSISSPHTNTPTGISNEQFKCFPATPLSYSSYQFAQALNRSDDGIMHESGQGPEEQQQQSLDLDSSTPRLEKKKANRLRKACDSCSVRKVKCDESGPPCRACIALQIPCTYNRPSRRRGPPNRHIEAIKRRRTENHESPTSTAAQISSDNTVASTASFSPHAVFDAESICPISTLKLIVEDFFTYLYPICPFPHEPTFRAAFEDREDLRNLNFLALLASMVEVTVLSLPRRSRLHFSTLSWEKPPPSILGLADCCHKVATEARGSGYLEKDLTIYDAVTSYFLGLAASYKLRWNQTKLYFGETLTITKIVGEFKSQDLHSWPGTQHSKVHVTEKTPLSTAKDCIKQEIARRVFWVLFVRVRSMQQCGGQLSDLLIPPPTPTDPYPPLPLEVDDKYIFVDHIDPQPSSYLSTLIGNNLNVKIYAAITPLVRMELARGAWELFDWQIQKNTIEDCFFNLSQLLIQAPRQFRMESSHPFLVNSDQDEVLSPYSELLHFSHHCQQDDEFARKTIQLETQKFNIYASQIASRCHLLERYRILFESYKCTFVKEGESLDLAGSSCLDDKDTTKVSVKNSDPNDLHLRDVGFFDEWKSIIIDFLGMICLLNANNLETNGGNLRDRILEIISSIISSPRSYFGSLAPKIQDFLNLFLGMLVKYKRAGKILMTSLNNNYSREEEENQRFWNEFQKFQVDLTQIEKIFKN
ncbi:hypothetical protein OnM2_108007 [Erysiphe neolycopersici]|uniref:Zn(2)-C6 fungal-type domain-containing protein n=1 Tax=Erysiphe neolycopersici TaxID=212602 RepID=A0A420H6V3_9PEZI|nr:hypothetical protein OnM2_108007 [Erysiphe neolycopersici]